MFAKMKTQHVKNMHVCCLQTVLLINARSLQIDQWKSLVEGTTTGLDLVGNRNRALD